jgi:hypothetical protein
VALETVHTPPAVWYCPSCGADLDAACARLTASCGGVCAELVIDRLERAGATLLAMRDPTPGPGPVRSAMPEVLRSAIEAYGWTEETTRSAIPGSRAISAMDRAYGWLSLIPRDRYVLRRVVAARSLVSPTTGRHVMTWRRLGHVLHCSHEATRLWHAQGVAIIVAALR